MATKNVQAGNVLVKTVSGTRCCMPAIIQFNKTEIAISNVGILKQPIARCHNGKIGTFDNTQ